jgi:heme-degrading monooxygenase HmoA
MVVKVIIERQIQDGKTRDVYALLNKFRSDAMNQPGYISGETLMDYDDPHKILVIGTWASMENWLSWRENRERATNEKLLEKWLTQPTKIKTYVLGTMPVKKK